MLKDLTESGSQRPWRGTLSYCHPCAGLPLSPVGLAESPPAQLPPPPFLGKDSSPRPLDMPVVCHSFRGPNAIPLPFQKTPISAGEITPASCLRLSEALQTRLSIWTRGGLF